MRSVHFPLTNCKRWWRRIRDAKHNPTRKTLIGSSAKVESRFTSFLRNRRNLGGLGVVVWSDAEREALLHCYASRTQPLREMKVAAIDLLQKAPINLLRCPYCQIRNPRTWDDF